MGIQEKLESMVQNSIKVSIGENEDCRSGATRFGGQPDVPSGFSWPTYEGKGFDDVVKERPLAFLAQFDCPGSRPSMIPSISCLTMAFWRFSMS